MPWRPKVPSPTWRSFLHNHRHDIAAVDMFVVATATFRLLYALIVLGHDRRRIIHFGVTENPTSSRDMAIIGSPLSDGAGSMKTLQERLGGASYPVPGGGAAGIST
jgi:hypothetical protein